MNHRSRLTHAASSLALVVALAACTATPAATPTRTPEPEPTSEAPSPTAPDRTTAAEPSSPAATPSEAAPASEAPAEPLLAVELTDVRSGETFTLAQLAAEEGPVLLEPMAIWCSSCRAQQHEVKRAHEAGAFTSVSLDVELSEIPEDLARYATDQDWDWHFAVADADLYRLLQERFGRLVTHPPSTPLIVVERDGTVRPLEFGVGVRSAEELLDELGAG